MRGAKRGAGTAAQTTGMHDENFWRTAKFAEPQAPLPALSKYARISIYMIQIHVWYPLRNGDMEMSPIRTDIYFKAFFP